MLLRCVAANRCSGFREPAGGGDVMRRWAMVLRKQGKCSAKQKPTGGLGTGGGGGVGGTCLRAVVDGHHDITVGIAGVGIADARQQLVSDALAQPVSMPRRPVAVLDHPLGARGDHRDDALCRRRVAVGIGGRCPPRSDGVGWPAAQRIDAHHFEHC